MAAKLSAGVRRGGAGGVLSSGSGSEWADHIDALKAYAALKGSGGASGAGAAAATETDDRYVFVHTLRSIFGHHVNDITSLPCRITTFHSSFVSFSLFLFLYSNYSARRAAAEAVEGLAAQLKHTRQNIETALNKIRAAESAVNKKEAVVGSALNYSTYKSVSVLCMCV